MAANIPTDNEPRPLPLPVVNPSWVVRTARKIWSNGLLREGGLLIVTAVAVNLATQLSSLLTILDTDPEPLNSLAGWVMSTLSSILLTAIRQAVVFATLKLGKYKL